METGLNCVSGWSSQKFDNSLSTDVGLKCSVDRRILAATCLPTFGRCKTSFLEEISTSPLQKQMGWAQHLHWPRSNCGFRKNPAPTYPTHLTVGATNNWRMCSVTRGRSQSTRAPNSSKHRHQNPRHIFSPCAWGAWVGCKRKQLQCGQTHDKVTHNIPERNAVIPFKKSVLFRKMSCAMIRRSTSSEATLS